MKLRVKSYTLQFKHPFGVSSNIRYSTPTILVRIECGGQYGYGEACLPAYLGEREGESLIFLEKAEALLNRFDSLEDPWQISQAVYDLDSGHNAAKAAIDIALCDLAARQASLPYYAFRSIQKPSPAPTSCTVAIDRDNLLEQKIREAEPFSILKIKAGTENDRELIGRIRRLSSKPLYVDVNQGWSDKHLALDMLHFMKAENVLLVEQPMPVAMLTEMQWLRERSPLPLIADEAVKLPEDIEKVKDAFSGINIKLMKCAGLRRAEEMISLARKAGLQVMLGCMAESSCATTAMAHLSGLADFIDLDAPLLITNDPFEGLTYNGGLIYLKDETGIGVKPAEGFFN